jgi:hypothetical protein
VRCGPGNNAAKVQSLSRGVYLPATPYFPSPAINVGALRLAAQAMDEETRTGDPEVSELRVLLAQALEVPLAGDNLT